MRLLILGGTGWLGRVLSADALARGHEVTCLARGESGAAAAGARFVVADRDEPEALRALGRGEWDAVVDLATQPGHVRRAVEALGDRCGSYCLISSVSVYRDLATPGQDERAPVLGPLEDELFTDPLQYGSAKSACEAHVLRRLGTGRCLLLRAGLIGGPGDPTGRSSYWPRRFAAPACQDGRVLVPDPAGLTVQLIDVRDLASWVLISAERGLHGTYNVTGDSHTLARHLEMARDVAAHTGPLAVAPTEWLLAHGVRPWMGARSLPLWSPGAEYGGLSTWNGDAARSAGLRLRPLRETLADTLVRHSHEPTEDARRGSGLTAAEERELLQLLEG